MIMIKHYLEACTCLNILVGLTSIAMFNILFIIACLLVCFHVESHVTESILKVTTWLSQALNWFCSCLHFPSTRISSVCHYILFLVSLVFFNFEKRNNIQIVLTWNLLCCSYLGFSCFSLLSTELHECIWKPNAFTNIIHPWNF